MISITPDWPAPRNIRALTTLRTAWHGLKEPSGNINYVEATQVLKPLFSLPTDPVWLTQLHSNVVLEACADNFAKIADAAFTRKPQCICAIVTADCLPILICNKQGTLVAAIHAGWRGLATNIIEKTIEKINEPAENLLVWFGPAISAEKYEVGKDVYDVFVNQAPTALKAFKKIAEDKWLANLYLLAEQRLHALNITHIYGGEFCTYSQPDLFYSYRRDKGQTGRMASLIWIDQ